MTEGKVIRPAFGKDRPRAGDVPIRTEHVGDVPHCPHDFVGVYKRARIVRCRQCGRDVDPFDVLVALARRWDSATYLDSEIQQRQKRIAELKREEANAKARARRLR